MRSSARGRARPDSIAEPDILDNLASFTRHLRAENKAPSTIVTYAKAVEQFDAFLGEPRRRRPRRVADVRREDVESFLVERSDAGVRPATLSQRFRSLQQFFKWLAAEGWGGEGQGLTLESAEIHVAGRQSWWALRQRSSGSPTQRPVRSDVAPSLVAERVRSSSRGI